MTIATFDQYIAAAKQPFSIVKTASRTAVALNWFDNFDLAGNPAAGVMALTTALTGVVPTDAVAGYPTINTFGGGAVGYLSRVDFGNTVACRMKLFDRLFGINVGFAAATTTLASQASYAARVPAANYVGLQIWIQVALAFLTGNNWQVTVTYTNQSGTAGRSTTITAALAAAALTLGKWLQLGLQAGDTGVQKIDSVIVVNGATAMTQGTFNVCVMRPLWSGRCRLANDGDVHDFPRMGTRIVYDTSAIISLICPDSTATGIPEFELEIANA